MNIKIIRDFTKAGKFFVIDHALTEAFKDSITFNDILYGLTHGKIIEDYPDRYRCLIFSVLLSKVYLHIVVDYFPKDEIDIVTVYIPDPRKWIRGQYRKRGK